MRRRRTLWSLNRFLADLRILVGRGTPSRYWRDRAGYEKYRREFSKMIWQIVSPKWNFDDATFDRSAASFDKPVHVAIVIHNYR